MGFLYGCRRAARSGDMFFYLTFKEAYDEKGRLDLIPINSPAEGTEDYQRIYEGFGFCVGMCFIFSLSVMLALGWEAEAGYALPTFIPFSLMLAAGLCVAPIFGLFIIEANENDMIKVFLSSVLGCYGLIFIGSTSGIDFSFLKLPIVVLFIPLILYRLIPLASGVFRVIARQPRIKWSASARVRKFMARYGVFVFSLLILLQGFYMRNLAELNAEENTWNNAVEVAMLLFIETISLILQVLEVAGQ